MMLQKEQLKGTNPSAPIAIDPPPYPPSYEPPQTTNADIYPLRADGKTLEGEMKNAFTLTLKEKGEGRESLHKTTRILRRRKRVDRRTRRQRKQEEVNRHLVNKLTQLQLNELTEPKKDKTKPQAPVSTVGEVQPVSQPTTPTVPVPVQPPLNPQRTTAETNNATPMPPIHVHVHQPPAFHAQDGNYRPRGRPGMRGRQGRYRGRGGMFQQNLGHAQSTHNLAPPQSQPQTRKDICWGCNQPGHRRRDCPVNPWQGPAIDWQ